MFYQNTVSGCKINNSKVTDIKHPESMLLINILSSPHINYVSLLGNDPRTVDNLVDGNNFTCDELHAWLAPFTKGSDHLIFMDMDRVI